MKLPIKTLINNIYDPKSEALNGNLIISFMKNKEPKKALFVDKQRINWVKTLLNTHFI